MVQHLTLRRSKYEAEITVTVLKLEQECVRCGKTFSFWLVGTRRHHCRCCWRAFCADCSSKKAIVSLPRCHLAIAESPPLLFRFPISTPRLLRVCATPALTSLVRSKQQLSLRARSQTWPQEELQQQQHQQQRPLARHLRAQLL